jgi:hypothetical protein
LRFPTIDIEIQALRNGKESIRRTGRPEESINKADSSKNNEVVHIRYS